MRVLVCGFLSAEQANQGDDRHHDVLLEAQTLRVGARDLRWDVHEPRRGPKRSLVLQDGLLVVLEAIRQPRGVDDVVQDAETHPSRSLLVHDVAFFWNVLVLLGSWPHASLEQQFVAQGRGREAEQALPPKASHGEFNCCTWVNHAESFHCVLSLRRVFVLRSWSTSVPCVLIMRLLLLRARGRFPGQRKSGNLETNNEIEEILKACRWMGEEASTPEGRL